MWRRRAAAGESAVWATSSAWGWRWPCPAPRGPGTECAPLSGSVGVLGTIDSTAILRLLFDRRVKQSCLMRLSSWGCLRGCRCAAAAARTEVPRPRPGLVTSGRRVGNGGLSSGPAAQRPAPREKGAGRCCRSQMLRMFPPLAGPPGRIGERCRGGQPARRMIASAAVACSSRVASAASSGMLPTLPDPMGPCRVHR
jgi:hypothetical protein